MYSCFEETASNRRIIFQKIQITLTENKKRTETKRDFIFQIIHTTMPFDDATRFVLSYCLLLLQLSELTETSNTSTHTCTRD